MADDLQEEVGLVLTEDAYRTLFDQAVDGVVIVDLEGYIWETNRATYERLGYQREELVGLHISHLLAPEHARLLPGRLDKIVEQGAAIYESTNLHKDGTVIPVEVSARVVELGDGRCIFAVVRDITERKRAEEILNLTQVAVDRSRDGVFWMDMEGRVLKVNDQACRSLGYTRAELVGKYVWDFDPGMSQEAWPARMAALRSNGFGRVESVHRRKDGTIIPIEAIANYVRYRDKEYNIAFIRDLSEAKRAHAAVKESEERLRQAVRVAYTGIFDHDHVADTIYWSPEHRALFGVAPDEVITMAMVVSLIYPEDRQLVADAIGRSHDPAGNGMLDIQHRIVRKDGELRWILTRAQTTFEGAGAGRRPVRTVGAVIDITDRVNAERKVTYLAFYDSLTGLANRRLLHDRLGRAQALSERNHLYGALMFIDLDHFKNINDTVGHEYGDALLTEVARRLKGVLRESDTISRPGGDEFVVILEEIGATRDEAAAHAKSAADKILDMLGRPYYLVEREYSGSASIGLVMFRGHEDSIDELLKRSDMAMYEAKRAGRGMACFFDPLMQAGLERRAQVESEMRKAIELDQLVLYFQARVGREGQVVGAEALLRWMHPRRGLMAPGEFIPICEESGLIIPVGQWVLEAACAQIKAWEASPAARGLKLSVNISGNQFRQDDFVSGVIHAIEKTGIDPARLELELTESMFLDNTELSIAKMRTLRGMGVLFALDDFGTGYSSLSYLKKLPLSQIKIDRSFVRDIAIDANDEVIVQTIIKMGQTLGLEVIAEGVETEEQRRRLMQFGCESFQGFLFGQPLPIDQFDASLVAAARR